MGNGCYSYYIPSAGFMAHTQRTPSNQCWQCSWLCFVISRIFAFSSLLLAVRLCAFGQSSPPSPARTSSIKSGLLNNNIRVRGRFQLNIKIAYEHSPPTPKSEWNEIVKLRIIGSDRFSVGRLCFIGQICISRLVERPRKWAEQKIHHPPLVFGGEGGDVKNDRWLKRYWTVDAQ